MGSVYEETMKELAKKFPGPPGHIGTQPSGATPPDDVIQKILNVGKVLSKAAEAPPTYRLRYHHLFNLGNYENESIDLEREFPASLSPVLALKELKAEVETMQEMHQFQKQSSISLDDGPLGEINLLQSMVEEAKQNLAKLQKILLEKTKAL